MGFILSGSIPRVGDKGSYTSREAYQRFIKSDESIKWYGFECIAIHGNRAIIETAKGYLHGRGDEMVYKIKSRSTPTFTQAQLSTMTLDELERYYNLDPNDLAICHAYIAKLGSRVPDNADSLDKTIELLEEQIYFAKVALANIERAVKDASRLAEVRKMVPILIEESGFEL